MKNGFKSIFHRQRKSRLKLCLAQIAAERLDEMQDPELTTDRALREYLQLGYSENWINQRLKSIKIRKISTTGLVKLLKFGKVYRLEDMVCPIHFVFE